MPLVPSILAEGPEPKLKFLATALRWYGEALLACGPREARVASAIASLEALFLGDNPPPGEISFRFTQRVVALLRCFGWTPLETRAILKRAYDVRSKYVHGAASKKFTSDEMTKLFQDVAECARVSCLIWMQIVTAHNRQDALTILEDSLIDEAAYVQLKTWCAAIELW